MPSKLSHLIIWRYIMRISSVFTSLLWCNGHYLNIHLENGDYNMQNNLTSAIKSWSIYIIVWQLAILNKNYGSRSLLLFTTVPLSCILHIFLKRSRLCFPLLKQFGSLWLFWITFLIAYHPESNLVSSCLYWQYSVCCMSIVNLLSPEWIIEEGDLYLGHFPLLVFMMSLIRGVCNSG